MTPKKRHPWRRAACLLTLALGALAFLGWSNVTFTVDEFTFSSPRLPGGFDGCRIVQLSDLHGARFGPGNRELLAAVRAAKPDYIAITGDIVDRHRGEEPGYIAELCSALTQIAPCYFVTGNHEWAMDTKKIKAELSGAGVSVLSNAYTLLTRNGESIVLAGIDDPNGYADQKTPRELASEVRGAFGDPFWLLLAHRNDRFAKEYSALGADLTLSGHGHGGLIRLPGTDGLFGTNRDLFPAYTAGFYAVNGAKLFVSRGLGNSGPTFRLFDRPEVAVLTLRRG